MKKTILVLSTILLTSCIDQSHRLMDAQKRYPKCVVQPSTSLIAREGYDVMVEDTISNQIYVLRYYPFSETRVADIRNIK